MEDYSRYLGVAKTLTFMCYIFSVVSQSDVNIISEEIGSTVTLPCNNRSLDTLVLLTWKRNEDILFINFHGQTDIKNTSEAARLNLNMLRLESQLYALIIENAQKFHTGNYTCDTMTGQGPFEQKWELRITEKVEYLQTSVIVIVGVVPAVCFLCVLGSVIKVCKRCTGNGIRPPTVGREEEIYENCLEIAAHQREHSLAHCHKPRAH